MPSRCASRAQCMWMSLRRRGRQVGDQAGARVGAGWGHTPTGAALLPQACCTAVYFGWLSLVCCAGAALRYSCVPLMAVGHVLCWSGRRGLLALPPAGPAPAAVPRPCPGGSPVHAPTHARPPAPSLPPCRRGGGARRCRAAHAARRPPASPHLPAERGGGGLPVAAARAAGRVGAGRLARVGLGLVCQNRHRLLPRWGLRLAAAGVQACPTQLHTARLPLLSILSCLPPPLSCRPGWRRRGYGACMRTGCRRS